MKLNTEPPGDGSVAEAAAEAEQRDVKITENIAFLCVLRRQRTKTGGCISAVGRLMRSQNTARPEDVHSGVAQFNSTCNCRQYENDACSPVAFASKTAPQ